MDEAQSAVNRIVPLNEGALFALVNLVDLDGSPVSTHPAWARGVVPFNCYLLVQGDEALLIDTGPSIHESAITAQLAHVLGAKMTLSLLILRLSEFNSVANARPIAERFDVKEVAMGVVPPEDFHGWLDFRPELSTWREPTGRGKLADVSRRALMGRKEVEIPAGRKLSLIRPTLQFLPTYWLYDHATRTLFTSDCFTHVWRDSDAGPWTVDSDECADPTATALIEYLLDSRYWWLAGANTAPLREGLHEVYDSYQIDCVAPAFGCILRGAETVAHHFRLMDEALEELAGYEAFGAGLTPEMTRRN